MEQEEVLSILEKMLKSEKFVVEAFEHRGRISGPYLARLRRNIEALETAIFILGS